MEIGRTLRDAVFAVLAMVAIGCIFIASQDPPGCSPPLSDKLDQLNTTTHILLGFILWSVCSVAGALIGQPKNRTSSGAMLGLFFGPIGILFATMLQSPEQIADLKAKERERGAAVRRARGLDDEAGPTT